MLSALIRTYLEIRENKKRQEERLVESNFESFREQNTPSSTNGLKEQQILINKLKQLAGEKDLSSLDGSVAFALGKNFIRVDGPSGEISTDESKTDCKIAASTKIMQSLIEGTSKPQAAFMSGELKVTGDMKLALQIFSILF